MPDVQRIVGKTPRCAVENRLTVIQDLPDAQRLKLTQGLTALRAIAMIEVRGGAVW